MHDTWRKNAVQSTVRHIYVEQCAFARGNYQLVHAARMPTTAPPSRAQGIRLVFPGEICCRLRDLFLLVSSPNGLHTHCMGDAEFMCDKTPYFITIRDVSYLVHLVHPFPNVKSFVSFEASFTFNAESRLSFRCWT